MQKVLLEIFTKKIKEAFFFVVTAINEQGHPREYTDVIFNNGQVDSYYCEIDELDDTERFTLIEEHDTLLEGITGLLKIKEK